MIKQKLPILWDKLVKEDVRLESQVLILIEIDRITRKNYQNKVHRSQRRKEFVVCCVVDIFLINLGFLVFYTLLALNKFQTLGLIFRVFNKFNFSIVALKRWYLFFDIFKINFFYDKLLKTFYIIKILIYSYYNEDLRHRRRFSSKQQNKKCSFEVTCKKILNKSFT
jgi:hypothetical protein